MGNHPCLHCAVLARSTYVLFHVDTFMLSVHVALGLSLPLSPSTSPSNISHPRLDVVCPCGCWSFPASFTLHHSLRYIVSRFLRFSYSLPLLKSLHWRRVRYHISFRSIGETRAGCYRVGLRKHSPRMESSWAVDGWKSTFQKSGVKKMKLTICGQKHHFNHLKLFSVCPHNTISRSHFLCFVNET